MSTLPAELIENILAHVYGNYRSPRKPLDLFRCALVCHTWRTISQSLIFSEVVLDYSLKGAKAFQDDDRSRGYIRRVWARNSRTALDIQRTLKSLPNLRELYILECRFTPGLLGGPDAELVLKSLTTLGLSGVSIFPIQLFYHCSSLRELRINKCLFDFHCTDKPASPKPQLLSLHITADMMVQMRILEWLLSPESAFDLTTLTTLMTSDRTDELDAYELIRGVVKLCAPTLRNLMIDPPTAFAHGRPPPQLMRMDECLLYPLTLSNLRSITISIMQESVDYTDYVPWMTAFFSQLPIHTSLEEIRIPCWFADTANDVFPECDVNAFDWEALDVILSSDQFKLKRVVISVDEVGSIPSIPGRFGPILRAAFPRLKGKGILEIRSSDTYGYLSKEDCWWLVDG